MKRALHFLSVPMLWGCIHSQPLPIHTWTELKIPGLILNLKDPKTVEWYLFGPDGGVAATFGMRGGPYCAPLYYWKCEDDFLVITDWDKKVIAKLRLLEVRRGEILVQKSSGAEVVYETTRD